MRAGAEKVETLGSYWWLDSTTGTYLRMPKEEGPRQSPPGEDWGGPSSGPLEDLTWHPFESWRIEHGRLIIELGGVDGRFVSAPMP